MSGIEAVGIGGAASACARYFCDMDVVNRGEKRQLSKSRGTAGTGWMDRRKVVGRAKAAGR